MARRAKRKNLWLGVGYLLMAALTLVVAGFIVRHDLGPSVWSAIIHRAPSRASRDPATCSAIGGTSTASDAPENLTVSERDTLSATLLRASHYAPRRRSRWRGSPRLSPLFNGSSLSQS
ncbi:MAG TPA: hypothetical protein VKV28_09820 [Candidatus Binataceae bacterium]|nr:hypothetical protein [Candidatus Binataceae bacterium]